jgi:hypothetical protein
LNLGVYIEAVQKLKLNALAPVFACLECRAARSATAAATSSGSSPGKSLPRCCQSNTHNLCSNDDTVQARQSSFRPPNVAAELSRRASAAVQHLPDTSPSGAVAEQSPASICRLARSIFSTSRLDNPCPPKSTSNDDRFPIQHLKPKRLHHDPQVLPNALQLLLKVLSYQLKDGAWVRLSSWLRRSREAPFFSRFH